MLLSQFFLGINTVTIICLVILCVLLLFSALASASETAFFSLLPNDINEMEESNRRADKLALELRDKPKQVLAVLDNDFVQLLFERFNV